MLNNNRGFTLVEMLIVLMIISVLILLIIPNLTGRSADIHDKGCQALAELVQAQVNAYHIDNGQIPNTLTDLVDEYVSEEQLTCQNGKELNYVSGIVTISDE